MNEKDDEITHPGVVSDPEMLTARVLRMVNERLTGSYDWENVQMLWVLAEEVHRIVEAVQSEDVAALRVAADTMKLLETTEQPNWTTVCGCCPIAGFAKAGHSPRPATYAHGK